MKNAIAFIAGVIFAVGLGLSGMTQPHIVKGFLNIFGEWDWRLLGVMIGAIAVHGVFYRFIIRRNRPILEEKFHLPTNKVIDRRLILGAAIFGLGWGWAGICPGPAIVSLTSGHMQFVYFTIAMIVGMKTFRMLDRSLFKK